MRSSRSSTPPAVRRGLPVTVRARIALDQGRSLLATIARKFTLAPNQHLYLDNMVRAIIGNARETSLGELHNLQLAIEVTEGRGSVVPFVVVSDYGTGDTYLRVEQRPYGTALGPAERRMKLALKNRLLEAIPV